MPAKVKVTKEMIIDAAFEVTRAEGAENVNARTVSQRLGCSTQPIMYHFATIEDMKRVVYAKLDLFHTEYLMNVNPQEDFMLGIGLNYIRFAVEEPNLFRFLFQSGFAVENSVLQMIDAEGLKTIRIPVSWHNHVDENDNISEAWLNRVQEVVDWSLEEDLYVILNIHHDNEKGFMYPSYEELDRSKAYVRHIWEQLAVRFADYDERLIFETLNEPRQTETDHEWWIDANSDIGKECIDCVNQLNQTVVDTIRENGTGYNTTRYIMVPGYCASPDYALTDGFVLPTDKAAAENRLLVSVHAYTPYNFALAGENDQNSTEVFSIADKKGTADIDLFMKRLYDKFISKGTAVVIGEFGARNKNNNLEARTEFAAYYVARARHYGMTACWWDNNAFGGDGENFGLLRRVKNQILFPQIVEQMVHYSKAE